MKQNMINTALAVVLLSLSACASMKTTPTNDVAAKASTENASTSVSAVNTQTLSSAEFVQALDVVKAQNTGDAVARPETSLVCQRLYDNYRLMAGYAPIESAPAPAKSGSPIASILGGTLEVASGIAGIAGVAGGTDALLKSSQISNALDGTNTIVGLYGKVKNRGAAKEAAALAAAPKPKSINVDEMAFSKGFQLNCPLAPMKVILDQ